MRSTWLNDEAAYRRERFKLDAVSGALATSNATDKAADYICATLNAATRSKSTASPFRRAA